VLVGLLVAIIGAVATWNRGLGPHWYPLALIALAVPPAWIGGKLHEIEQARKHNAQRADGVDAEGQLR